jgi:hypothetical protein
MSDSIMETDEADCLVPENMGAETAAVVEYSKKNIEAMGR